MRGNAALQEDFAQLMVPSLNETYPEDSENLTKHDAKVYVIDGLLDLTLNSPELLTFDLRFAACECLKAYFAGHANVKLHFLSRAIEGYRAEHDEVLNIFTVLLRPSNTTTMTTDPYRVWFAAVLAFHLLSDAPIAKSKAFAVTEGDASSGEEVVTSVQIVAAHLITGLRHDDDVRILAGYLMLLLGWLFEDIDGVNDFLSEGSYLQGLIEIVTQRIVGGEVVQGLCAMLLGVLYEFSTKDSPIPRTTLHSMLLAQLDREKYIDRLTVLRGHPSMRDFEVTPQKLDSSEPGLLPDVYFDGVFVNFFKDNYSRMSRAIDREPGFEVSVVTNGIQKGVSRDLVDSLRVQVEQGEAALQDAQAEIANVQRGLEQEQADHRKSKEEAAAINGKSAIANEGLQKAHEAELRFVTAFHH